MEIIVGTRAIEILVLIAYAQKTHLNTYADVSSSDRGTKRVRVLRGYLPPPPPPMRPKNENSFSQVSSY